MIDIDRLSCLFSGLNLVLEGFVQMLVIGCDLVGFWLVDESCDELVVEDVQLEEDIIGDLAVLDLQINETERLQSLNDFTEDGRFYSCHLLVPEYSVASPIDIVEENSLGALRLKLQV